MAAHDEEYGVWSELDMDLRNRASSASWVSGAMPPGSHVAVGSKPEPIPVMTSQPHSLPHSAHPPPAVSLMGSAGISSSGMPTSGIPPGMSSAAHPSPYGHPHQPPMYNFPSLGVSMAQGTDSTGRPLAAPQLPGSHAYGRQDGYLTPLHHYSVNAQPKPDHSRWGRQPPPPPPHHGPLDMRRLPPQQHMYGRAAPSPAQPPANTAGGYAPQYSAFTSFEGAPSASDIGLHDVGNGNPQSGDGLGKARASLVSGVSDDVHGGVVGDTGLGAFGQAETATSSSVRRVDGIMSVGMNGSAVGALNGIIKTKQRRRYAKPKSSRYCHLCARHERAVKMFACGNVDLGICQKSVCAKCFEMYGLDLNAAKAPRVQASPRWTCPHCQNCCPKKAKCHSYDRQTERRRMKTRELKRQLALKVQVAREATST